MSVANMETGGGGASGTEEKQAPLRARQGAFPPDRENEMSVRSSLQVVRALEQIDVQETCHGAAGH